MASAMLRHGCPVLTLARLLRVRLKALHDALMVCPSSLLPETEHGERKSPVPVQNKRRSLAVTRFAVEIYC
eukprot:1004837-Rhodomonas_salina.1